MVKIERRKATAGDIRKQIEKSFPGAVQWVLSNDFIDNSAVAMANFAEIREHGERIG